MVLGILPGKPGILVLSSTVSILPGSAFTPLFLQTSRPAHLVLLDMKTWELETKTVERFGKKRSCNWFLFDFLCVNNHVFTYTGILHVMFLSMTLGIARAIFCFQLTKIRFLGLSSISAFSDKLASKPPSQLSF